LVEDGKYYAILCQIELEQKVERNSGKYKGEFALEQTVKVQRGSRSIALLFLQLWRQMGVGGQRQDLAALPGKDDHYSLYRTLNIDENVEDKSVRVMQHNTTKWEVKRFCTFVHMKINCSAYLRSKHDLTSLLDISQISEFEHLGGREGLSRMVYF